IDFLDEALARLNAEVAQRVAPFEEEIVRGDPVPGVNRRTREVVIAESGVDMSRFPSSDHVTAWAGLAPGNNQSAGQRKGGKTRKGSRWLRAALINAAHAAARKKGSALAAQYKRI